MYNNNQKDYASKGMAGTGLGFGIGATALSLLQSGALGNVLGGGCNSYTPAMAEKDAKIAKLETEVKLRDANIYTDQKITDAFAVLDGRIRCLEGKMCDQQAYNAANNATLSCIQSQVQQLYGLAKLVIPQSSICTPTTTTAA